MLGVNEVEPVPRPLVDMDSGHIRLKDSILTLDALTSKSLSFLSSFFTGKPDKNQQFMSTAATLRLLGYDQNPATALVCDYNHPFAVGRLKLEFLPSGLVLGSSSLYVEHDGENLLYAPHLVLQKSRLLRQVQLKPAQTLLLGAFEPPIPKGIKEFNKDHLVDLVLKYTRMGVFPVIMCSPYGLAQEILIHLLSQGLLVKVHPKIHSIVKIYEEYGVEFPRYYLTTSKRKGISLTHKLVDDPMQPLILIEDHSRLSPRRFDFRNVDERFYYSAKLDGKDLKEIITTVQPEQVYLFGPYAKALFKDIRSLCPRVSILNPHSQPALF